VDLIAQTAKECSAQLVAVKGYSQEEYPRDREYVEGDAVYLFMLEHDIESGAEIAARSEAEKTVFFAIRDRVRVLADQKYGI
jgi:hypothetical protein